MWLKGYTHYHTCFSRYPGFKLDPKIFRQLDRMGAQFVFCSGDHGAANGDGFWGFNIANWPDYTEACSKASAEAGLPFVPFPEIHLRFKPLDLRREHHACLPIPGVYPPVQGPEDPVRAASFTYDLESFFKHVKETGVPVILNHAYLSTLPTRERGFNAPSPVSVQAFENFDCIEIVSRDRIEYLDRDFVYYCEFHRRRIPMGCTGGLDNQPENDDNFDDLCPRVATHLYIEREAGAANLINSLKNRNCYASIGDLVFDEISPVPSAAATSRTVPELSALARCRSGKTIQRVKIFKNGHMAYHKEFGGVDACEIRWEDEDVSGENAIYVIYVEADDSQRLISGPICFKS